MKVIFSLFNSIHKEILSWKYFSWKDLYFPFSFIFSILLFSFSYSGWNQAIIRASRLQIINSEIISSRIFLLFSIVTITLLLGYIITKQSQDLQQHLYLSSLLAFALSIPFIPISITSLLFVILSFAISASYIGKYKYLLIIINYLILFIIIQDIEIKFLSNYTSSHTLLIASISFILLQSLTISRSIIKLK